MATPPGADGQSRARVPIMIGLVTFPVLVFGLWVAGTAPRTEAEPGDARSAPQGVLVALRQVFDETRCVSVVEARTGLRALLDGAGLNQWSVHLDTQLSPDACVSGAIEATRREVVLVPALRPVTRAAMERETTYLIDHCLSKHAAVLHIEGALMAVGEQDFEVRTDGPMTAPIDRIEDVRSHVQAGCWVYSGTGWTPDGVRLFFVSGL